jgi:bifunctional diaminopimelate decarboxylase / aspartate kinase
MQLALGKVTQTKSKGSRMYIGCEIGMNSLIRQALYGSWHDIYNLSKIDQTHEIVANVVGPICESSDVLGRGCFFQ